MIDSRLFPEVYEARRRKEMNEEKTGRERRAPGTRVNAHFRTRVTWMSPADDSVQEGGGSVINVSPSGALLALDESPQQGQEVFIHVAPAGEQEVAEDNQVSFPARTLWTAADETGGESGSRAAFELDFTGPSGEALMRRWMELIYEPLALSDALEGGGV